jgi:hypothetical protein
MKIRICIVALCFLIFHCSAAYGQMAQLEYKQLPDRPSDELLNHYAKYGWEIASSNGGDGHYRIILKRSRAHTLFGTKTPDLPRPEPPPQTCKLTLAQAPVIRELRLGMTSDELFTIFPSTNERADFDRTQQLKNAELSPNYGYTSFEFNPSNYATKDRFTGISSLAIGLFDRKVAYIRAQYSNTPQFDSLGQLMEIITRHFGLPEFKDWPDNNKIWFFASLNCGGFTFDVNASSAISQQAGSGGFLIELTDATYKKIAEDRKKADMARKREGFKL